MTREKPTMAVMLEELAELLDVPLPEVPDAPQWFMDGMYGLGVERGSGTISFWESKDGVVHAESAFRANGIRYEVNARGDNDDDAARAILVEVETAIARSRDSGPADAGSPDPVH